VRGLDLCRGFFFDVARPLLLRDFGGVGYAAGLIGYGSDVLGYDDAVSGDHMWGPRFYLFVQDAQKGREILEMFSACLPYEYLGYSVNFSAPDLGDNGVRRPERICAGRVSPLIFVHTIEEYLEQYLGRADFGDLTEADWLGFCEHKLLSLVRGEIFVDEIGLGAALRPIRWYPHGVVLRRIAGLWGEIADEQAFVRRAADAGDDLGSAIICGRIAEKLMRLGFLYCGQYAPYAKWFGRAFAELPLADTIKRALYAAVFAACPDERENNLVEAQKLMAFVHNESSFTNIVNIDVQNYYGRKIKVIYAEKIAEAVLSKLRSC